MDNRGRKMPKKSRVVTNGLILLLVMFVFSAAVLLLMFADQRRRVSETVEDIAKSAATEMNEQLSLINQMNKAIFLARDMQDIFADYRTALFVEEEDDFTEIVQRATDFMDAYVQLDQSLIKEIAYIPLNYEYSPQTGETLYYGLNVDVLAGNLFRIAEIAAGEEYARGAMFIADILYDDNTSSNFYAFGRNILDIRSYSEYYMKSMGIGILAINKNKLLDILDRSETLGGLELGMFYGGKAFLGSEEVFSAVGHGRGGYFVEKALTDFDAEVVAYYSWTSFFKEAIGSTVGIASAIVLVCLLVMICFIIANAKTSRALRFLFTEFSKISAGCGVGSINYTKNREVDNVIESFNRMIESLTALNAEMVEQKTRSLRLQVENIEFQLDSLYAQINKHFLINVLSAVRSLVNTGEAEKAKACLENLGDFLRYSLSMENISTLDKELESIKLYLEIQKVRFPKIGFSILCDDEARGLAVPKMILQPVVENAFSHSRTKKISVSVVCRKRPYGAAVFVFNDGGGLEEQRAAEVNTALWAGLSPQGTSGNRLALSNIQKRIRLSVGEGSSIRIRAVRGGALTFIRLALQKKEEKHV